MKHFDYDLKPIEYSDQAIKEIYDLIYTTFGGEGPSIETIRWQYLKNPLGKAVGFNAYFGPELAGHYVTIPTQAKIRGMVKKGLLSLNTATHPKHQKKGLFTKLANLTYEDGKHKGYEFVVGVANHNSVHGFTKKLGFQHVGMLESRLFLVPPQINDTNLDFAIEWNKEYLQWRLSRPNSNYSIRDRGGRIEIYADHRKLKIKILVQIVKKSFRLENYKKLSWQRNPFYYWIGHDPRATWTSSLSLKVPKKLKKIPLNLIFKDLVGDSKIDFNNTAFYSIDFDAY